MYPAAGSWLYLLKARQCPWLNSPGLTNWRQARPGTHVMQVRTLPLCFAAILSLAALPTVAAADTVAQEVIVQLKASDQLARFLRDYPLTVLDSIPNQPIYRMRLASG